MYKEPDENKIEGLIIQEEDICFLCQNKYDCPLICSINSNTVDFVDNKQENIVEDCDMFKKQRVSIFKRIWEAIFYE